MPWGDILLAIIVGGVLAYLVRFIPMHETLKKLAVSVVILAVALYVLNVSGLVDWLNSLGSPRRRT